MNIADSQFAPRLTHNAKVIYGRLYRRFGQVVTHEELRSVLYVRGDCISGYMKQIRDAFPDVEVRNVRGVGYAMMEKTL